MKRAGDDRACFEGLLLGVGVFGGHLLATSDIRTPCVFHATRRRLYRVLLSV